MYVRTMLMACAIGALARVSAAQELLAIRFNTDDNLRINPANGDATQVVRADTIFPRSLAWNSATQTLHTIDFTRGLVTIDLTTGDLAGDLPLLFSNVSGLTYDPSRDLFFGVDGNTDSLFTIDPVFGNATPVGEQFGLGFIAPAALAYHEATDTLYSVDIFEDVLFTIDPETGQTTPIGPLGFGQVESIAFHPTTGQLFGVDNLTQSLITIDPTTGAGTFVGDIGTNFIQGLVFTPTPGAMGVFVLAGAHAVRRRRGA